MSLDELIRSATSRAGVVRVRNALNPLLWLCAVASPLCFGFAYAFSGDPVLRYGLVGLGASPIVAGLVAYLYLMLHHPDRLQSEEFMLRQMEIRITERKRLPPAKEDSLMIDDSHGPRTSTEERK